MAATPHMAVHATFQSMGLRCKKAVAGHLLLENTHENNLLSDIANADYLAGNLGRTALRPLEGLPPFVDDIYVFGYLRKDDCVSRRGAVSCTTGPTGAACGVVSKGVVSARASRKPPPWTGTAPAPSPGNTCKRTSSTPSPGARERVHPGHRR